MAFLDPADTVNRLYNLLPANWFPDLDDAPNLKAILSMLGAVYSNNNEDGLYQFIEYVQRQTRVATAEGFWLDIFANDFFGNRIQRNWPSEPDSSFRRRIMLNLLAPRGSRCALASNVTNLTGYQPKIIELRNTGDCGAYSSLANPIWGGAAYNQVGAYGSMTMPFQLFIQTTRPPGEGIPNVNGYGMPGGGYATYPKPYGYVGGMRPTNFGNCEYVQMTDIIGPVTDKNIYDTVAQTMPAGTIAWTSIANPAPSISSVGVGLLDTNFYLDYSLFAPEDTPSPGGIVGYSYIRFECVGLLRQGDLMGILRMLLQIVASGYLGPSTTATSTLTITPSMKGNMLQPAHWTLFTITVSGSLQIAQSQPLLGSTFVLGQSPLGWIAADAPRMLGVKMLSAIGSFGIQSLSSANLTGLSLSSGIGVVQGKGPSFSVAVSGVSATSHTNAVSGKVAPTLGAATLASSIGALGQATVKRALSGLALSHGIGVFTTQSGVAQTYTASHMNTHLSLSNGNDTVTHDGTTSTWGAVYGAKTKSSGKYYWELVITSSDVSQDLAGFGVLTADVSDGSYCGASGTGSIGWVGGSQMQVFYQSNPVATWAQYNSGDRICLAVDLDNKKFWGRVGNGNWNGSATDDPATNTGGYDWSADTDLTSGTAWTPGVSLYTNDTSTTYFTSNTWSYTAPTGFGAW